MCSGLDLQSLIAQLPPTQAVAAVPFPSLSADYRWPVNELGKLGLDLATKRSKEHIVAEFRRLPFEPYAPVRRQLLLLLRAVNRARIEKGFEQVSQADLNAAWRVGEGRRERWLTRRVVRPFVDFRTFRPGEGGRVDLPRG